MRMFRVTAGNEEGFGCTLEDAISACLYTISAAEKVESWKRGQVLGALTCFTNRMTVQEFMDWCDSMGTSFTIQSKDLSE